LSNYNSDIVSTLTEPACNEYAVQVLLTVLALGGQVSAILQFFLIGILGGGVQLGQLVTAATNRPIVPAPGDYDDGEIGGMIFFFFIQTANGLLTRWQLYYSKTQ
jgi:hypothetical protein